MKTQISFAVMRKHSFIVYVGELAPVANIQRIVGMKPETL
jgi:hypothetical protein